MDTGKKRAEERGWKIEERGVKKSEGEREQTMREWEREREIVISER